MSQQTIRVRFAPSPTGYPHVGNIRTALFNWLFARHNNGTFILRIEDTDQSRKVDDALDSILGSLKWLGLDWDEGPEKGGECGPYFQSERLDLYHSYAQHLLDKGHAYKCYCSPERLEQMRTDMAARKESVRSYDRYCRNLTNKQISEYESQGITPVIRFKIPLEGQTTFHDLIRGDITFENTELDDLVLLKSDGYPTYHLANIVDDHHMKISHVLRADEWLSSTPRHTLLYKAFGWKPPLFAHLPMILGPDKSKLSKRHGATAVTEFQDQGYLPQTMINFMALLGWSLDDKTEIFSKEELIRHFSIERISKTGAVFNHEKLYWMNGAYLRELSHQDLQQHIMPVLEKGLPPHIARPISDEYVRKIVPLIQERINTFNEAATYADFFFLDDNLEYDPMLLIAKKMDSPSTLKVLIAANERLSTVECFDHDLLETTLRSLADELGFKAGQVFSPLRVACTGRTATPPLFETMTVLGKERCLARIKLATKKLQQISG
ncbi:MAG: glutamate--tRNA ligase [Chloroflexota bacterium]|nr:glutamate--tRNA ligase [Chloroflexota bacterium]